MLSIRCIHLPYERTPHKTRYRITNPGMGSAGLSNYYFILLNMKDEREIIDRLLSIIEAQIDNDAELDSMELDEFIIASIWAHKKYGRACPHVYTVVNMREGVSIHDLVAAGLTLEDLRRTYDYKKTA